MAALALAALVVFAFVIRARFLLANPYPYGIDGYYYAVQVRELVEHGRLNYAGAPVTFLWLAPFGAAFGPIVGVKLGAAAASALAVIPAYDLGRRIAGARVPALIGAVLVAISAQSQFLTREFVKQGVGLTVVFLFLAVLAWLGEQPTRRRAAAAGAVLGLAFFTHKTAFAFCLLLGAPALVALGRRLAPPWRARVLVAGAVALLALVGVSALMPAVGLGLGDLRHAADLFHTHADLSAPALVFRRVTVTFGYESLIAAGFAALAIVVGLARRPRVLPPLVLGAALTALFLALPWLDPHDPQGAVFRLRAAGFVTLPPLVAFVLARGATVLPSAVVENLGRERLAELRDLILIGLALGLSWARPSRAAEGVQPVHPALVTAVRALEGVVPEGAIVVCNDRQVAFMARYYAGVPIRLHPLPPAPAPAPVPAPGAPTEAPRFRLIPLGRMHDDLPAALTSLRRERPAGVAPTMDLHPFDENGLVLIPESTFAWLLERVRPATRRRYLAWDTT